MSTREAPLPKFAVGCQVRVKKGVTAPNCPDVPMVGWRGKVYEATGTICLVHWSDATLEAIHSVHRGQRQWDGGDFRVMWLQEEMLETDSGEPQRFEQSKEELRPAG